ncbi:MAG: hypothetical protein ACOX9B_15365, partial [Candidatus Xenobium sp.]
MVYRDYLMQQHPALAAYLVGVCSRHRGDEEFGPHVLGMFDLLRLHGLEAVAAACTLAADEKAYGDSDIDRQSAGDTLKAGVQGAPAGPGGPVPASLSAGGPDAGRQ